MINIEIYLKLTPLFAKKTVHFINVSALQVETILNENIFLLDGETIFAVRFREIALKPANLQKKQCGGVYFLTI